MSPPMSQCCKKYRLGRYNWLLFCLLRKPRPILFFSSPRLKDLIDIGNHLTQDSSEKDTRFMPFVSIKSETLNEEKAGKIRYMYCTCNSLGFENLMLGNWAANLLCEIISHSADSTLFESPNHVNTQLWHSSGFRDRRRGPTALSQRDWCHSPRCGWGWPRRSLSPSPSRFRRRPQIEWRRQQPSRPPTDSPRLEHYQGQVNQRCREYQIFSQSLQKSWQLRKYLPYWSWQHLRWNLNWSCCATWQTRFTCRFTACVLRWWDGVPEQCG